jgi:hypothetical protein
MFVGPSSYTAAWPSSFWSAVVNLRVDWARLVLSPSRSAHELADWCAVVNLRVDWARLVLSPSRSAHELADWCAVINLRVDWARLVLSPSRSAHELADWWPRSHAPKLVHMCMLHSLQAFDFLFIVGWFSCRWRRAGLFVRNFTLVARDKP